MIGTALLRRPLALLATVLAVGAASSVNAQEVTIATWGGSYGKAIQEAVATPFEKATGVKVKMIAGVSLSNMQMIAAQKANPQVDIITLTTQDATRAYAEQFSWDATTQGQIELFRSILARRAGT